MPCPSSKPETNRRLLNTRMRITTMSVFYPLCHLESPEQIDDVLKTIEEVLS